VTIVLLFLVMIVAFLSSLLIARERGVELFGRPIPIALGLVFLVTASLSTLQFAFPEILTTLERNRHELAGGQLWRLGSPLFVQDGGWVGTLSNLIWLFLLGSTATALLGARRWLVLYFGTGVIAEVLAYTVIHQGYAGNSIANFGVAAGLLLLALRGQHRRIAVLGVVGMLAGIGLLVIGNLHGAAFAVGLIISLVWIQLSGNSRLAIPFRRATPSPTAPPSLPR
jgi:membrane associated rhomboid family serine protease